MKNPFRLPLVAAPLLAMGLVAPQLRAGDEAGGIDATVVQAEQARIAAAAKAIPSVLAIFSPGGQGGGSGVVISPDGYALTNFHVAKPCGNFMKCGMADGKLYDAVIVGLDPVGDVGMVKLYGRDDFPTAELADSDQVQVGDWCFAMGNPFLLATDFHPTVSYGVVSGVHRYQYPAGTLLEYTDCLQVDAAINPGNSGGPLFDAQGRLIGINGRGSFEKRGRVNVGVGYSISINQIKNFLGHLKSGRILDHATLGARVTTSDEGHVLVSDILEQSDAYRRGLRYDDEIISFAGRPVRSVNALKNVEGIFPRGWRVALGYRRDGKDFETFVRLMGVHTEADLLQKVEGQREIEPQQPRQPRGGRPGQPPKPGEQPKPGDQPRTPPKPDPALEEAIQTPVPEGLKKQFEARTGFANYYFNRENTQRVWKGMVAPGDFADATGVWTLKGKFVSGLSGARQVVAGGAAVIHLDGAQCDIDLPTTREPIKMEVTDVLDHDLSPAGSGGLLSALHLWRKMLIGGPAKYGQVTYEGLAPVVGHEGLCDVMTGISGGVDTLFYCDPTDGRLVCLELYPGDEEADPCEIYFSQYRMEQGRPMPHRLEVRHGDALYGTFTLSEIELQKAALAEPESKDAEKENVVP